MVQYVGETRVLSLPRLCLRGRSLDTIASQIRRNGLVTFRSHDDPIFLPYPRYSSPRSFRLPIPAQLCSEAWKQRRKRSCNKRRQRDGIPIETSVRAKPNVEASIQNVSSMRKTTRVLKASWFRNLSTSTKIHKKFLKLLH